MFYVWGSSYVEKFKIPKICIIETQWWYLLQKQNTQYLQTKCFDETDEK